MGSDLACHTRYLYTMSCYGICSAHGHDAPSQDFRRPGGLGFRGRVLVARLSGTGRLADDLYLMAHDDRTGKPLLQPRAAGLGLAGALLAELVLAGRIEVEPGGI